MGLVVHALPSLHLEACRNKSNCCCCWRITLSGSLPVLTARTPIPALFCCCCCCCPMKSCCKFPHVFDDVPILSPPPSFVWYPFASQLISASTTAKTLVFFLGGGFLSSSTSSKSWLLLLLNFLRMQ